MVGCGYLGITHAACMAELGHNVLGVDQDLNRVTALNAGNSPIFEPGVDDLLARHTASGRLRFTSAYADIGGAAMHFIAVGTPQQPDNSGYDLDQLFGATQLLAAQLRAPTVVVGMCTVPVGTASRVAEVLRQCSPAVDVELVWHPEFLRESHAVADILHPDRMVFGFDPGADLDDGAYEDRRAEQRIRECFASIIEAGTPTIMTDWATAEMIKAAANAFLATKLSFINGMSEACDAVGADVYQLANALGHDHRIGHEGMHPGLGYGGGCLSKDIGGFGTRLRELGLANVDALLHNVNVINDRCRTRLVDLVCQYCGGTVAGKRIAVWGAAFKPGTDDIRDSPALAVIHALHCQGADVVVFDPKALDNTRKALPELEFADEPVGAVDGADILLHLTDWAQFTEVDPVRLSPSPDLPPLVIDGRGTLDSRRWSAAGWVYRALGRPQVDPVNAAGAAA